MPCDDYIPHNDQVFGLWAQSLSACIAGEPEKYRFSPEDASQLVAAVQSFTAALDVASMPDSRTPLAIRDKRHARKACESMCRRFAMAIKNHPAISVEDKINAGLRVTTDRQSRRPIERPQSRPLLNVIGSTPYALLLRYADIDTPASRAKPHGVASLNLFMGPGHDAAADDCRFIGSFTRNPIELMFSEAGELQHVTFYGRWSSARGELGPWSLPVCTAFAA